MISYFGTATNYEVGYKVKAAAFFDLDRTLINFNSAISYAKWERKHRRISLRQLFEASFFSLLYHFDLLDMERAYAKATSHFKGRKHSDLAADTEDFFKKNIADRIQRGAVAALREHRRQGHQNILLSSTSSFQGAAACQSWDLDDFLTNEFPAPSGSLDGTFAQPLCYHAGKVHKAEAWAAENNVCLDHSYFYSDSITDLPMLERVGHPRVVNPDPKLKRLARRRGWQVLKWK